MSFASGSSEETTQTTATTAEEDSSASSTASVSFSSSSSAGSAVGTVLGTYNLTSACPYCGDGPKGAVYDGTDLWVTPIGNSAIELAGATGSIVGTAPSGAGQYPSYDGTNVWVAQPTENGVALFNAETGASANFLYLPVLTYAAAPQATVFDGSYVWVTDSAQDVVYKIDASSQEVVGTCGTGVGPRGLMFDGAHIWVANSSDGTVTEYLASASCTRLATYPTVVGDPTSAGPTAIAFDGTNVWVANQANGTVAELSSSGTLLTSTIVPSPSALVFDGTSIWATSEQVAGTVSRISIATGEVLGMYEVGQSPNGIAYGDSKIWVTNGGGSSVTALAAE